MSLQECGKSSTTPTLLPVAGAQKDTTQVALWKLTDFGFFMFRYGKQLGRISFFIGNRSIKLVDFLTSYKKYLGNVFPLRYELYIAKNVQIVRVVHCNRLFNSFESFAGVVS